MCEHCQEKKVGAGKGVEIKQSGNEEEKKTFFYDQVSTSAFHNSVDARNAV